MIEIIIIGLLAHHIAPEKTTAAAKAAWRKITESAD